MKRTVRMTSVWSWPLVVAAMGLSACSTEEQPAMMGAPMAAAGSGVAPGTMPGPGVVPATMTGNTAGTSQPNPGMGGQPNLPMGGAAAPNAQAGNGSVAMPLAGSMGTMTPVTPGDVNYHQHIRPLIEARCTMCHTAGGAMEKIPLDTWTSLEPFKGLVVNAVKTRRMPPWLADSTNCTKTRGDQRLSDEQLALFTMWEANGFPAGDESKFMPLQEPPVRTVSKEPDMLIKARTPFQLTPGIEDYFCLATDARFEQDTWVYAMDMVPQNPEYVHHAIVNIGNTCSALGVLAENIYSYRPGSRTMVFEEGDAMLFPAGSSIYIQFHYNTRHATRGQSLPTDQSPLRLWTLPAGQMPQRKVARMPHHDMNINIPVNAVNQREGGTQSIGREFVGSEIIGISPHMHYLGQVFKETLRNGGQEVCLVDIPDWDQAWQLDYFFNPEDYIKVASGASVSQTCLFSNRPEDQGVDPTGKKFTPQHTIYGEDTRQEMCLGYIWFRTPIGGAR